MFIHDKNSAFKDQKNTKPKIEDIVSEHCDTHYRENILEFIAYLKENKMTTRWASVNSWNVVHKSKNIAWIKLFEGSWYIDPIVDFNDINFLSFIEKEKLEKIIWNNVELCTNCLPSGQCTPGYSLKILSKEFKNVCRVPRFKNPKINEIKCIKKIFEFRKGIICEDQVQKTFYVGKKKRDEYIKKYGGETFNLAYEAMIFYLNQHITKEKPRKDKNFSLFVGLYEKAKEKNPKIDLLKLFETGIEEYSCSF